MRWADRTRAQWIISIGSALYDFSSDLELVDFNEGMATIKILNGEYSEDFHVQVQDHIDKKLGLSGEVAIFFQEEGNS